MSCLLKAIPLIEKIKISEAHIIPKAAGGKIKTFLCTKCNSFLGTKQDKWFGEFVKLNRSENASIFETDIKDRYFWIDGIRVNGTWKIGEDGAFKFYYYKNKNAPSINKLLVEKNKHRPHKMEIELPLPLLRHDQHIRVGLLTAGYLMWFNSLGYSWIFQSHLNQIRKQILNPDQEIMSHKYFAYSEELKCDPWIGIIHLNEFITPAMGIDNMIVIFPPADHPGIYSLLNSKEYTINIPDIMTFRFEPKQSYEQPVSVIFYDRLIVSPDNINTLMNKGILLYFSREFDEPLVLTPITDEEYNKRQQNSNTVVKSLDFRKSRSLG